MLTAALALFAVELARFGLAGRLSGNPAIPAATRQQE